MNWGLRPNIYFLFCASMVAQMVKNLPAMPEIWVPSLDWKDSPEEGMGTHSCLATSWTEEPGGLQSQSVGSQRVRHD